MRLLEELTELERIVLREALEAYRPTLHGVNLEVVPRRLAVARELIFKLT